MRERNLEPGTCYGNVIALFANAVFEKAAETEVGTMLCKISTVFDKTRS